MTAYVPTYYSYGATYGAKGNVSQGTSVTNLSVMGNDVIAQVGNLGTGIKGGPVDIHSSGSITNETHIDQDANADTNETANFAKQSGGGL